MLRWALCPLDMYADSDFTSTAKPSDGRALDAAQRNGGVVRC
ncbi:MAG TPA: hypothetical protein VN968_20155 [Bradyrhizobium sp.]|jgi:hypothetical protein|nr:hypothetical protein [Bradyrhizobium sp.]